MKHYDQLNSEQRYQISGLKKAGLNRSKIADEVGVHKSIFSRELRRNKGTPPPGLQPAQRLPAKKLCAGPEVFKAESPR